MKCPNCQSECEKKEIKDDYGQDLEIDFCPNCQGFWFDRGELFRLPFSEAEKIDKPKEKFVHPKDIRCPHDSLPLEEFKDPHFPSLALWRCPGCNGYFLPSGQVYAYAAFREKEKRKVEISEKKIVKTITTLSIFAFFLLFALILLKWGELSISADPLKVLKYKPTISLTKSIIFWLFLVVLILLLSLTLGLKKKKK